MTQTAYSKAPMSKPKTPQKSSPVPDCDQRIYRLKLTLNDTNPPVWRRLEVFAGIAMDSLASAIDGVFGWSGEHMGVFKIKGRTIGDAEGWSVAELKPSPLEDFLSRIKAIKTGSLDQFELLRRSADLFSTHDLTKDKANTNESDADREPCDVPTLGDLVPHVRTKFTYTYDLGDDWKHLIEVEKILPSDPGGRYPRCADGARANPIEDCGGPWGFAQLVQAAGDPNHERFAELEEWGLKKWDPEKFSLDQANRQLAKIFRLKA